MAAREGSGAGYSVSSEHAEQAALFLCANSGAALDEFPELEYMHAVPNGGARDARVGARMKAEGVKRGVPDVFLDVARGPYHGLRIEMKYGKNKPTKEQIEYMHFLAGQGYRVHVRYSAAAAQAAIEDYLRLRP